MKNLKIKYKILLPLLVLLTIVSAANLFQLKGMSEINDQTTVINKDIIPRIELTLSMALEMSSYRRSHFAYLLSQTPEQDAHYIKRMEGFATKLEDAAKQYNGMIRPDQDEQRKHFDEFIQNWEQYKILAQQSFQLKAQGQTVEASDAVLKDGVKLYETGADRINKIVEVNKRNANNADEATSALYEFNRNLSIILIVALFIFGLLIVYLLVRSVAKPINNITDYMNYLSQGNLDQDVPSRELKDEVGDMARSVQVFKDNMVKAKELEAAEVKERAAKEVRQKKIEEATAKFEDSMENIVKFVSSASTELQMAAQSLAASAEETSVQSNSVAAASEEASTNVQTVASASEELSSSINEIAQQVTRSSEVASKAVHDAQAAGKSVAALVDAAQKIGDVTRMISDIAEQTNLLALNATIEAARAGESGKGFAVVASEVKNLANESTKATVEISNQIAEVQEISRNSAEAIQSICDIIEEMNNIASSISAAIQEQTAATQEISRNVSEAYSGTSEVSRNIVSVSDAANDTGSASQQVLSAAGELSKQSSILKEEFESYIKTIASA